MLKGKNKIIPILILSALFCSTSYIANAEELNDSLNSEVTINTQEKEIYDEVITRNWLTEEVAKQLNKEVSQLKADDFSLITKIDLRYERISVDIPNEIRYMKNLQYLDLNYCKLDGTIPESLGELNNIKHLDLGDNNFKEIPENLLNNINANKYEYVDVEGNEFKLPEGWYTLKGKLCYLNKYGDRVKGEQNIDGLDYIFDDYGNVKNGFDTMDGKTVYYDGKDGILKDKWKQIDNKWYYFNNEGFMLQGLQNINGVNYYLDNDGSMLTGLQNIDNKPYYFDVISGAMQYGIVAIDGKKYYFDENTGEMIVNSKKTINGTTYVIKSDGILANNEWVNDSTYVTESGQAMNITGDFSHSYTNLNLFKYMTDKNNRISVYNKAVELHGGITSNNCVYFTSEALRRIGIALAQSTCNTYDLEDKLQNLGFVASYDLSVLKPGDIVFTNNYTHVYIFMYWASNGYAYVVDNQPERFNNKILHLRQIYNDTNLTDRATHFYYLPY